MDYLAADLEPLADRHTLLFYDQRGAGRSTLVSDSTGLAAQRFVDDLEAMRTHFALRQLTLLGHSWGAGVAALYAARYPASIKQLLIVDGVPLRRSELVAGFETMNRARDSSERREMQRWMETRRAHPEDPGACHAYYRLWFRPFFSDPTILQRSRGDFCAGTPDSRRNKLFAVDRFTMAFLGDYDWRGSLKSFPARTLVIHGAVDPIPLSSAEEWGGHTAECPAPRASIRGPLPLPGSTRDLFQRRGQLPRRQLAPRRKAGSPLLPDLMEVAA